MKVFKYDGRFASLGAVVITAISEGRTWQEVFSKFEVSPAFKNRPTLSAGMVAQALLAILEEATTPKGTTEVIKAMQVLHRVEDLPTGPTRVI